MAKQPELLPPQKGISPEEAIYQFYPRKVGRPVALKAIARQIKKFGYDTVFAATVRFAEAWDGATADEMTFCPHPSTWFNQERFNDAPETWERRKPAATQSPHNLKLIMEAKQAQAAEIKRRNCSEVALGDSWKSPEARSQYYALIKEAREINARIAAQA